MLYQSRTYDRRSKPAGVSADEQTPIVLQVCDPEVYIGRVVPSFCVISCPNYVFLHVFDYESVVGANALVVLARLNHSFSIQAFDKNDNQE